MAPNDPSSGPDDRKIPNGSNPDPGATTVLDSGTVESRGHGTEASTREEVTADIHSFLTGEAGRFGFSTELRALLTACMFMTRLPVPTWVDLHPGYLMMGMAYFPLLGGVLVGSFVGTFYDAARVGLDVPSSVAAAFSTAAGMWMTGCLHEDGLADSADGMGGGWTRDQILRIMTDTRLGTYGCAALILCTVAKVEVITALDESHWEMYDRSGCDPADGKTVCGSYGAGPAILVAHTLSRMTSPYLLRTRDYVDEGGPKSQFYSFMVMAKRLVTWRRVSFGTACGFIVTSVLYGPSTASGLIGSVFVFAHIAGRYGERTLGGVMGDFLGATICACELVVLALILASRSANAADLVRSCVVGAFASSPPSGEARDAQHPAREAALALWSDGRVRTLLRFVAALSITAAWTSLVGRRRPPLGADVPVRDGGSTDAPARDGRGDGGVAASEEEGGGDDDDDGDERRHVEDSPRTEAARALSSPLSTFGRRYDSVRLYLDTLAKPIGSLGALEDWAARLSALQRTISPDAERAACLIFASDHGVAADPTDGGEGCSSYPQSVTRCILRGLERGVAGASVLAKTNGVRLRVVDVGVAGPPFHGRVVMSSPRRLVGGTRNFCDGPAMSGEESERCVGVGRDCLAEFVRETSAGVVALGEVGIGNTTSSSALIAALTGEAVESVCGGGAYSSRTLDEGAVSRKVTIVERALRAQCGGGRNVGAEDALAKFGGAEIAALVGAMLEASDRDIAVLVDGFIVTTAAMVAASVSPDVCRVLFLSTESAEGGQRAAVDRIRAIAGGGEKGGGGNVPVPEAPALSMGLRMGEGTGALLAVPILRGAAAVLSDMGTIQDILED